MNYRYMMVVVVGAFFSRMPNSKDKINGSKVRTAVLVTLGALGFAYFKEVQILIVRG